MVNDAVLISASCTTSWFDWIHGELWLCPEGLLRRALGLRRTVVHLAGPTVDPDRRPRRSFTSADILEIVAAGRRNRWILLTDVSFARLKRGPRTTSLHIDLVSGAREKFLWLASDGGDDVLAEAFDRRLAGRWAGPDSHLRA
jgi:hypothetical protein